LLARSLSNRKRRSVYLMSNGNGTADPDGPPSLLCGRIARMSAGIICVLVAAAFTGSGARALVAQSASPGPKSAQFEVASVKLHTSSDQRTMMVAQPGGRFVAANVPLRLLIRTAFQLQDDQIVGGPDWLASDRFDIEARAAGVAGPPTAELLMMLQSLLTERFALTTHREIREISIFLLERARRDRSLGAGLRPTTCPELAVDFSGPQRCANISNGSGSLTLRGMPFNQFTPYLAPYLNRVVVDRTGLDGRYDIDLSWRPSHERRRRGRFPRRRRATQAPSRFSPPFRSSLD
jgi:uncharacterized protein (TIGR03435 family)